MDDAAAQQPSPGLPFVGSTSSTTRQQRRSRRYLRLHRDVFLLLPGEPDFETRCDAALLTAPDARLSHTTAGLWWKLPVDDDGRVHLTRAPNAAVSRLEDVQTHRSVLHPDDLDTCDGRPVLPWRGPSSTWPPSSRSTPSSASVTWSCDASGRNRSWPR